MYDGAFHSLFCVAVTAGFAVKWLLCAAVTTVTCQFGLVEGVGFADRLCFVLYCPVC